MEIYLRISFTLAVYLNSWVFCWSQVNIDNMQFGVLGSGIIGLSTALELQREYPNAQVSIIADSFIEDTTSYVAAGIFRPSTSFMGPSQEITQ